MNQALIALYLRHVGIGFDRQLRLAEFLEREAAGQDWNYTISTATLTFGADVRFEAHDLGSHAAPDNSWLWAWANPHLKLTAANRELAAAVRSLALAAGVPEFAADRQFDLGPVLGELLSGQAAHVLALVIAGELGYDAYYTLPFAHGRAAAVIRDDRLRFVEDNPLNRIAFVFPQVLSALPILDHRAALLGYARALGVTVVAEEPGSVRLAAAGGGEQTATFDQLGRLTRLEGTIAPGG
jgi:hypothetical protein